MKSRLNIKKSLIKNLLAGIAFILLAMMMSYFFHNNKKPDLLTRHIQNEVYRSFTELSETLKRLPAPSGMTPVQYSKILSDYLLRESPLSGDIILAYYKDTLIFWSDNVFAAPLVADSVTFAKRLIYSGNGLYLDEQYSSESFRLVAVRPLKYKFQYRNDYLKEDFGAFFRMSSGADISLTPGLYNVKDRSGAFLFALVFHKAPPLSITQIILLLVLYVSGLLFLIAALFSGYILLSEMLHNKVLLVLAFIIDAAIIRFLTFYFRIPHDLYNSDLFSPVYYASSSVLPSLGDLLINALVLTQVVFLVHSFLRKKHFNLSSVKVSRFLFMLGSLAGVAALYEGMRMLIRSVILNSNFLLSFYDFIHFNIYSVLGILAIALILSAYLFVSDLLLGKAEKFVERKVRIITGVVVIIMYLSYFELYTEKIEWFWLIAFIIWLAIYLVPERKTDKHVIINGRLVAGIFILAALVTQSIHFNTSVREREHRILLASHLSDSRDLLAEYYYKEFIEESCNDLKLSELISLWSKGSITQDQVNNYLLTKYFNGFWSNYTFQFTLCGPKEKLLLKPGNFESGCNAYFADQIATNLEPVPVENLYFLKQSVDITYYLGYISYRPSAQSNSINLYIEFTSKRVARGMGYPELLVNKSLKNPEKLSGYSYAYYIDNELVKSVGKYAYNTRNLFPPTKVADRFFVSNGFSHLIHRADPRNTLIVSMEKPGFLKSASPFSFMLVTLLIVIWAMLLLSGKHPRLKILIASFRIRMQLMIVMIVLLSLLMVAFVTLIYISQLNIKKNNSQLSEKLNSVLTELEYRLGNQNSLSTLNTNELDELLVNLSNSHFIDLNLFSTEGVLVASSKSQIFDEGLISALMNPVAKNQLYNEHKSVYIQRESIGSYRYFSAYAPVRNLNNKLIGYLNMPYFSRQEELSSEISGLVATFANIYTVIATLSIFLTLLLSKYITKPLQLIREQMVNLKLGNRDAKINWQRSDEIGNLISEYNRMVDELARSAELLAKSERESAWREMARQVAHEIKNPLTPIKLSMQLLLKAWEDRSPDWENRLNRFSQTLIMQIDTLSAIASEFSDFAQMPETVITRFDVIPVLQHSAELFKDATGFTIKLNLPSEKCFVNADEKQMLRVFNNLIKNAIQAIPSDKEGLLEISIINEDNYYLIQFSDNGLGISPDQQLKIFSPNFTTKTAGMGLGLAMVKNIVDNINGQIWFESAPGKGTTFFIRLPRIEE